MSERSYLPCDYSACLHPTCVVRDKCLRQRLNTLCLRQVYSTFSPPPDGPCQDFIEVRRAEPKGSTQ